MPRPPRYLSVDDDRPGFYHVYNRVAGSPDFYPFAHPRAQREFQRRFLWQLRGSCLRLGSFTLMSNHFHLVLYSPAYRDLSRRQLSRHARHFYGRNWRRRTADWTDRQWKNFNRRLFNLSPFMQQFEADYATWYNRQFGRRGSFWADRFKANRLADPESVRECIVYNELNGIRTGRVQRPEQWKASSARWRWLGRDQDLIPLEELFEGDDFQQAWADYRGRLLYRGAEPGREGQAQIPAWVVRREQQRGFPQAGTYRKRLRFFTDGLVLGTAAGVKRVLEHARRCGLYRRRRHPIPQLQGCLYTLREQRSTVWRL